MRESRRYGLFEKQDTKWVRLFPTLAFTKTTAVRLFQDQLLAPYMGGVDGDAVKGIRELKVVKDEK